ncbi:MAG: hypothetical protein ACOVVK_05765 [Elsteraceae bacterium]
MLTDARLAVAPFTPGCRLIVISVSCRAGAGALAAASMACPFPHTVRFRS